MSAIEALRIAQQNGIRLGIAGADLILDLAAWKDDYNTIRPHSAIGNQAPAIYARLSAPAMQRDGALELFGGSAPRPVAPPGQTGSNAERTLLIPG